MFCQDFTYTYLLLLIYIYNFCLHINVCVNVHLQKELPNKKDCPHMCAYKLVTVKFKWWGLQNKVENFIQKVCFQVEEDVSYGVVYLSCRKCLC